jgi:hypothetical protein
VDLARVLMCVATTEGLSLTVLLHSRFGLRLAPTRPGLSHPGSLRPLRNNHGFKPAPASPGQKWGDNLRPLCNNHGLRKVVLSPDRNLRGSLRLLRSRLSSGPSHPDSPLHPDARRSKGYRVPRPLAASVLPARHGRSVTGVMKVCRARGPQAPHRAPLEPLPAAQAKAAAPRVAEVPAPRPAAEAQAPRTEADSASES